MAYHEESPGCSEAGFRLTDGHRKVRDSATESRPPSHVFTHFIAKVGKEFFLYEHSQLNILKTWAGKGETAG